MKPLIIKDIKELHKGDHLIVYNRPISADEHGLLSHKDIKWRIKKFIKKWRYNK